MDDAVDLDRIARASSGRALEASLPIPDQIECVVVAGGEDVVADLDATRHLRAREVLHDAHFLEPSPSVVYGVPSYRIVLASGSLRCARRARP